MKRGKFSAFAFNQVQSRVIATANDIHLIFWSSLKKLDHRVSYLFFLIILIVALRFADASSTIFSEDFEIYAPRSNPLGQWGWINYDGGGGPILITPAALLCTQVANGHTVPRTGDMAAMVRPFSSSLDPLAITMLSADGVHFSSGPKTHNTELSLVAGTDGSGLREPVIIKVLIRREQDLAAIELLIARILTKEPNYLVAEVTQANLVKLRSLGFQIESPCGEDYVLRILKVFVHSREDVERIVAMGFDVPEVHTDFVIALGYDWQIEKLKHEEFSFEWIRRNGNLK